MYLKTRLALVIVIWLTVWNKAESARILGLVATAAYSHQSFFQQIWRELAIQGHEMVVITTDPTNEKLPNLKEISIRESYVQQKPILDKLINGSMITMIITNELQEKMNELIIFQMQLPQVQELLHNETEHFDLLMVELINAVPLAFKHRFNCPMIGLLSLDGFPMHHAAMGNPTHSLLYPTALITITNNPSFAERIQTFVIMKILDLFMYRNIVDVDQTIREVFGDGAPGMVDLLNSMDMLFVNANPLFAPNRPFSPSTINLAGGIHLKPEKPLPKELKDFLDSAKEGAIYVSLGSNVKSNELTPQLRKTFVKSLAQIPYKVLWKFEDESLSEKPDNVKITKWTPQQDVLRHKNIKLFVTQGGIQSLEEALYCHVPLIVIPFFADQEANANNVESKGMGLVLDRHNLHEEDFVASILEVMNNGKYRSNVEKLATRIQDEPMKPLDKAVWWTEYVLRHKGAPHLKSPQLPAYQYYYMDILLFFGMIVLLLIVSLISACKVCTRVLKKLFLKGNGKVKIS